MEGDSYSYSRYIALQSLCCHCRGHVGVKYLVCASVRKLFKVCEADEESEERA